MIVILGRVMGSKVTKLLGGTNSLQMKSVCKFDPKKAMGKTAYSIMRLLIRLSVSGGMLWVAMIFSYTHGKVSSRHICFE